MIHEVTSERDFFGNLPAELKPRIRSVSQILKHAPGGMIHQRGDTTISLSLIQVGNVRMSQLDASGERITTTILSAGDTFGMYPLLSKRARSHDAHAVSEVELMVLSKARFDQLLAEEAAFRDYVIGHLSDRLGRALEALDDERRLPLIERLGKLLLQRSAEHDPIQTTQSALAQELGVSRYGLGLAIKALAKKGLVSVAYRQLSVPDHGQLQGWLHRQIR